MNAKALWIGLALFTVMVTQSGAADKTTNDASAPVYASVNLPLEDWIYVGLEGSFQINAAEETGNMMLVVPAGPDGNHVVFLDASFVKAEKVKAKGFTRAYLGWTFKFEYPGLPHAFPTHIFLSDEESDVVPGRYPWAFYYRRGQGHGRWISGKVPVNRGKKVLLAPPPAATSSPEADGAESAS